LAERGLAVSVVYAAPGVEAIVALELPAGSTVGDALAASRLLERNDLDPRSLSCAIHGERADTATPLEDGDRVELVRPLFADPRDVRRRRAVENPLPRTRSRRKTRKSGNPTSGL
jgi:uncharacterized protein